jgi:AraC family transcriptional regulator
MRHGIDGFSASFGRLSSRPDGWRRRQWSGGSFETAHRPLTAFVEGCVASDNHLIMTTLSGGAERHQLAIDGGHRYDGPDLPSSISFLPAGCERRLRLHNVEWRWASIALDPQAIARIAPDALRGLAPIAGQEDRFVWNLLSEFDRLDALDGGLDEAYCETMSHALLLYLARRYGRPAVSPQRIGLPGARLRRISDFIDAHLDATIRIADLAQLADLSEGHFHRAFRATTGQTPLDFIHARRVAAAKHALVRSEASVTQIALDVGFQSPTHFARVFRAATGQAPSDYRRTFRL